MKYVSIDEVFAIHYEVINKFGGSKGINDFCLLHSAVERPRANFNGKDLYITVFDKAAALLHSLLLNHPFRDGNKRTAYIATARFLLLNNYSLKAKKKAIISYLLKIEKEKLAVKKIALWIKKYSKKTVRRF